MIMMLIIKKRWCMSRRKVPHLERDKDREGETQRWDRDKKERRQERTLERKRGRAFPGRNASRASLRSPPSAIDNDYERGNRREKLKEAERGLGQG